MTEARGPGCFGEWPLGSLRLRLRPWKGLWSQRRHSHPDRDARLGLAGEDGFGEEVLEKKHKGEFPL